MTQSICTANQARQADTLAIQQYRQIFRDRVRPRQ